MTVNGLVVSEAPAPAKFVESIDEAFIRIDSSLKLRVYNLGVFVREFPKSTFGVGGVVVSKLQLDVNFARNDILQTCKIWKAIRRKVDTTGVREVKRKIQLSDDERVNVIQRLLAGEMTGYDAFALQIFKDVCGRAWSAKKIQRAHFPRWSLSHLGDRVGETLIDTGDCLVLDREWMGLFECDPSTVFEKFNLFQSTKEPRPVYADLEAVKGNLNESQIAMPEQKWTAKERVWLDLLGRCARYFGKGDRQLRLGTSNTANAWTDGYSYIYFSREYLHNLEYEKLAAPNLPDITRTLTTLAHEYCHDQDDCLCMVHGSNFDQKFRDRMERNLHPALSYAARFNHATFVAMEADATEANKRAKKRHELASRQAA